MPKEPAPARSAGIGGWIRFLADGRRWPGATAAGQLGPCTGVCPEMQHGGCLARPRAGGGGRRHEAPEGAPVLASGTEAGPEAQPGRLRSSGATCIGRAEWASSFRAQCGLGDRHCPERRKGACAASGLAEGRRLRRESLAGSTDFPCRSEADPGTGLDIRRDVPTRYRLIPPIPRKAEAKQRPPQVQRAGEGAA